MSANKPIETAYIKCDGKGLDPVAGTDRDGLKGKCPNCPGVVPLTFTGMISSHLVGGVNAPASKALTERGEAVRVGGEGSRSIGNVIESAGFVKGYPGGAPLVRGRDMSGAVPVRRTREEAVAEGGKRTYAEAAGTMAGSTGRMHLDGGVLEQIVGGKYGDLMQSEYDRLTRTQQRRYRQKVKDAKDAAARVSKRRREYDRNHGGAVQGSGPTAARPYGEVPAGSRVRQEWDASKGGRIVETIGRRAGDESLSFRMDAKPAGVKYKSEPIFGRTVRS